MSDPTTKDFYAMSQLLCECRKIIDNIIPGCAAGHDELSALKYRVDLFYTEYDSRLPNVKDHRGAGK